MRLAARDTNTHTESVALSGAKKEETRESPASESFVTDSHY